MERSVILRGGQRLYNVHSSTACDGEPCPIHNVTNHVMRSWDQEWTPEHGMRRISPITGAAYRDPDQKVNGVRCHRCGDEIVSRYRWDYVTCGCGDVSVDGGFDYYKRSWKPGARWTDLQTDVLYVDGYEIEG